MQLPRWFVLKMSPGIITCIHPQNTRTPLRADNPIKFWFTTAKKLLAWNTKESKSIPLNPHCLITWCCSEHFLVFFFLMRRSWSAPTVKRLIVIKHFCSFWVCNHSWQYKCWAIASCDKSQFSYIWFKWL